MYFYIHIYNKQLSFYSQRECAWLGVWIAVEGSVSWDMCMPPTMQLASGQYASYWNAYLLHFTFNLLLTVGKSATAPRFPSFH